MSVRIMVDKDEGFAALYDSVSETAFGPLFEDADEAERFISWMDETGWADLRRLPDTRLRDQFAYFREQV